MQFQNFDLLSGRNLSSDEGNANENVLHLYYFAIILTRSTSTETASYPGTKGAFWGDYSRIRILGIDGICVLLGAVPFSE